MPHTTSKNKTILALHAGIFFAGMHKTEALAALFRNAAEGLAPQLVAWRRHLHAHPELSFQEHNTMRYVAEQLQALGINEVETGIGDTGVVAHIHGRGALPGGALGHLTLLRGDMDALPIKEVDGREYGSTVPGVMHACGHDVHTACLLGAAALLHKHRNEWAGTVRLLFQPGEEKLPGGATLMVRDGALAPLAISDKEALPSHIIGQHVMPLLDVGQIGIRSGAYMAATDELEIDVHGVGHHGAFPEKGRDAVLATAAIIMGLQQAVSRWASPTSPTVLSIGEVLAKGTYNVVPPLVSMKGTLRTHNEAWRTELHNRLPETVEHLALAYGCTAELRINKGYPALYNHPRITQHIREVAEALVGKEQVIDLDLWMAGEDFAYYLLQLPGCFVRLGTRNVARGITASVHTPNFDVDEAALPLGAAFMALSGAVGWRVAAL